MLLINIFNVIPAPAYAVVYNVLILGLCLATSFVISASSGQRVLHRNASMALFTVLLSALLIFFIGMRPESPVFGDSFYYAHSYGLSSGYQDSSASSEWLWENVMYFFKSHGFSVNVFFTFVDLCYFGFMLLCCWRLFPNNTWLSMLFCLASFSCYSYSMNGIRNGMACSLVMLAMSCVVSTVKKEKIVGVLLCLLALFIHRSTALSIMALGVALLWVKSPRVAIGFWCASIVISLLAGNMIGDFIGALGFDDRMSGYLGAQSDEQTMVQFSSTGFRFDFLLYSAMPVLMTWYVTIKRNFEDRTFNVIAITYILANSFWIMVIRAAYSNRFAYLSWFLYPIVIAYPLLRFRLWDDQDRKTAIILLLYEGFTFTMFLLGM